MNVEATIDKGVLDARQASPPNDQAQQSLTLAPDMAPARHDSEAGLKEPLALAAAKAGPEQLQTEIVYRVASIKLAGVIGVN